MLPSPSSPPPPLCFLLSVVYLIIVLSSALLLSSSASSLSSFEKGAGSTHHLLNHSRLRPHHPPAAKASFTVVNVIVVLVVVDNGCGGVPWQSCNCLVLVLLLHHLSWRHGNGRYQAQATTVIAQLVDGTILPTSPGVNIPPKFRLPYLSICLGFICWGASRL